MRRYQAVALVWQVPDLVEREKFLCLVEEIGTNV